MRVLLCAALALLSAPANADYVASRYGSGSQHPTQSGLSGQRGTLVYRELAQRDAAWREAAYQHAAAFGRCLFERDEAASIAYVRAGASGRERRAFGGIRDLAESCRRETAPGLSLLRNSTVRLSAVADALRARQTLS